MAHTNNTDELTEKIQKDFHKQMDALFARNKKLKRADLFAVCVYMKLAELETRIAAIEKRILEPK